MNKITYNEKIFADNKQGDLINHDIDVDRLADEKDQLSFDIIQMEMREKLYDILSTLSENHQKIISMRYGLWDNEEKTYKDIWNELWIPPSKVSKIEKGIFRYFRCQSRKNSLEEYNNEDINDFQLNEKKNSCVEIKKELDISILRNVIKSGNIEEIHDELNRIKALELYDEKVILNKLIYSIYESDKNSMDTKQYLEILSKTFYSYNNELVQEIFHDKEFIFQFVKNKTISQFYELLQKYYIKLDFNFLKFLFIKDNDFEKLYNTLIDSHYNFRSIYHSNIWFLCKCMKYCINKNELLEQNEYFKKLYEHFIETSGINTSQDIFKKLKFKAYKTLKYNDEREHILEKEITSLKQVDIETCTIDNDIFNY